MLGELKILLLVTGDHSGQADDQTADFNLVLPVSVKPLDEAAAWLGRVELLVHVAHQLLVDLLGHDDQQLVPQNVSHLVIDDGLIIGGRVATVRSQHFANNL
jgi:hypothetical protein